jgi:hypothetical protein
MTSREQPTSVTVAGDIRGAAGLGTSAGVFSAEAVREAYVRHRTERVRAAMAKLDGSVKSSVALVTGLMPEEIDAVGGVAE